MQPGRQFGPLYHGTSAEAAEAIMREGYNPPEGHDRIQPLSHGHGVYTTRDEEGARLYAEDHDKGAVVEGYVKNPKIYKVPPEEDQELKEAKWRGDAGRIHLWNQNVLDRGYNVAEAHPHYDGDPPVHVVLDPKAFVPKRISRHTRDGGV